jgi:hypothetical protein
LHNLNGRYRLSYLQVLPFSNRFQPLFRHQRLQHPLAAKPEATDKLEVIRVAATAKAVVITATMTAMSSSRLSVE